MATRVGVSVSPSSSRRVTALLPTDFSGCQLWLRANRGVTLNGATVSAWADQSGNGNNATQGTAANQPTYGSATFAGFPALDFDGVSDFLSVASADGLNPGVGSYLLIVAGRWLGGTGAYKVWAGKGSGASADNWRAFRTNTDKLDAFWGSDVQPYPQSAGTIGDGVDTVLAWGVDAVAAEVLYVIGATLQRTAITVSGTGSNALAMRIGSDAGGGYPSNVRLAELAFYKRAAGFSDAEITSLASSLAVRYGL